MTALPQRFLESTRGQVLARVRRGLETVEELARDLDLTDNAIRAHLASLERDGLVRQAGTRRGAGAGKPAVTYQLTVEAEARLSSAYAPVLTGLLEELAGRLPSDQREALMLAVGRRLAQTLSRAQGTVEQRVRDAVALLNELGGDAVVEAVEGGFRIRGCGCPLSVAVERRREACQAVQGLVSEIVGASVTQCCEYEPRPRCCFTVPSAA